MHFVHGVTIMAPLYYRNFSIILFCICVSILTPQHILAQKEDTAHLLLKKTAVSPGKTRSYVVKKGEWIFEIMRKEAGITSHRFSIIKKLNPTLKNVHKIYPGQVLILPEIEPPAREDTSLGTDYFIQKGDSITRVATRHLKVTSKDIIKTVNAIKRLNPNIKNYDKIYPGQVLHLPRKSIVITKQADQPGKTEETVPEKEPKEKKASLPEASLALVSSIITQMNGSLVRTGSYYIPLPQMGQVTIDCTAIPVAELDDGSTILIDFFDRIPESLKQMIQSNWKNYRAIKVSSEGDSTATIMNKIIGASNSYTMTKAEKPLVIGDTPPVSISIDWLITKKPSPETKPFSQALSFVSGDSQLLPGPVIHYANRKGFIITEIMNNRSVARAADEKSTAPDITILNAATNIDFVRLLLTKFGYSPSRDVEIGIFDTAKDGFNVSVRTDILVKKGERQILIFSRKIPQQFIDNLKSKGTDVFFIEEGESRKTVIEKALSAVNTPFSFGNFSFSIPEKTAHPRCAINFSAFKITQDKENLYLIDFDMDREIYGLLNGRWEVKAARY
ncbi:MAG: LysM peptidoglycan-binding domain-containing protein [Deltaproteobacteria bacterium]|nr:LysM peptidoglycan-binding domain-containing protein [Deltaproteobacteria bacterium]